MQMYSVFLGEYNGHVLSELLGYSSVNIAKLEEKGVLLSRNKS
ncbi:MAG: hypothetical protein AB9Q18_10240 [Candidatus Reddybacter sp.]